jgi:hypothetical protein
MGRITILMPNFDSLRIKESTFVTMRLQIKPGFIGIFGYTVPYLGGRHCYWSSDDDSTRNEVIRLRSITSS